MISFSNCAVAEGKEGYGIRIGSENQPGFIRYPAVRNLDPQRGTIEFWVRLNWDCTEATSRLKRVFFDTGTSSSRNRIFIHSFDYTFLFGIFDSAGGFHFVDSSSFPDWKAGQWHHVACGWDLANKQMLIRVDDQIESSRPSNPDAGDWKLDAKEFQVMRVGSYGNIATPLNALVDELKIRSGSFSFPADRLRGGESEVSIKQKSALAKQAFREFAAVLRQVQERGIDVSYSHAVRAAAETGFWRMEKSSRPPSPE